MTSPLPLNSDHHLAIMGDTQKRFCHLCHWCLCLTAVLCYSPQCSRPPCRRPAGPLCTGPCRSSASTLMSPARCCCTAPEEQRKRKEPTQLQHSVHARRLRPSAPLAGGSIDLFLRGLFFGISVCGTRSIICQLTRPCVVYTTGIVCSLGGGRFNES